MATFSNNGNVVTNNQENDGVIVSFSKIFGYMFVGLLITAAIAMGFGALCQYSISAQAANAIIITAAILQLVLTLIIQFKIMSNGNNSILVPAILYCVVMGFLLGSFGAYLGWALLGGAFLITALIFGVMTLIVLISKGNFNIFATIAIGLVVGGGLLALLNLCIMWWANPGASMWIYWVVSFVMFIAIMCITIYDIYNIKKIVQAGCMNKNTMMFCAFQIYVDFIAILIKVLYYLAIATRN